MINKNFIGLCPFCNSRLYSLYEMYEPLRFYCNNICHHTRVDFLYQNKSLEDISCFFNSKYLLVSFNSDKIYCRPLVISTIPDFNSFDDLINIVNIHQLFY